MFINYYAQKYMKERYGTTSFKFFEELLKEDFNRSERWEIGVYLHLNNFEFKTTLERYPNSMKLFKEYENSRLNDWSNGKYFKFHYNEIVSLKDRKNNINHKKELMRRRLLTFLRKNNLSINSFCKTHKLKYSNVYNFLKKKQYTKVNLQNLENLLTSIE